MKTQQAIPGGDFKVAAAKGGKQQFTTHNSQSNKKRSTVMNTVHLSSRTLMVFVALCLVGAVALGQNIINTGRWVNTGTVTATNFTNSGANAAFINSGGASLLRIRQALTTNANGANPENFDVTSGEVRYMGNENQTINHLVKNNTYNNLSTTGAVRGTKTFGGNITVTGTLTSDGNNVTVDIANKVLTVKGTNPIASTNNGAFTFSGGTVNYDGADQSVFAATYGTLGTTAAGNKSMAGNVTVNTALNLSEGNLRIGSGNTLTIGGALNRTNGTLQGSTTSNMSFVGTGNATLPGVTDGLGTLVINRTGATDRITLDGDLTIHSALTLTAGDFRVGSARTLTLNDAVTATAGTLSSAADGTVNYNRGLDGQNVLAANYGNLTFSNFNKNLPSGTVGIAGVFTPGTATGHTVTGSTVIFNGGAQNIPSFNGTTGYNHLSTAGGFKTVTGNLVVGGNFINGSDVTTNVGTFTLSIAGTRSQGNLAATMQFGGTNNGLLFTTGTVEYNGADQNIAGHASDKYERLLLSGSGIKTVQSGANNTVHTTHSLTVNSGITLRVQADGFLNVDGDLTNNGTVENAGTIRVGTE